MLLFWDYIAFDFIAIRNRHNHIYPSYIRVYFTVIWHMVYGNNVYDLISTMYVDTFKAAKYQAFYYPKTEGWSKYIAIRYF